MGKVSMDAKQLKIYRLACEVLAGKLQMKDWLEYQYYGFKVTHFTKMVKDKEQYPYLPKKSIVHSIAKKHNLVKSPRRPKRRNAYSKLMGVSMFDLEIIKVISSKQ